MATIIQRTIVGDNTEEIRIVGNADANYCISPYKVFLRSNLLQLNDYNNAIRDKQSIYFHFQDPFSDFQWDRTISLIPYMGIHK